jgi:ribonuclease P protein component
MKTNSFTQSERLTSRKDIDELFKVGKTFFSHPLRSIYHITSNTSIEKGTVKVVFIVAKRSFKKAVTRNQIRRRIREAYRLNKHELIEAAKNNNEQLLNIAFVYSHNEVCDYNTIEISVVNLLRKLEKALAINKKHNLLNG